MWILLLIKYRVSYLPCGLIGQSLTCPTDQNGHLEEGGAGGGQTAKKKKSRAWNPWGRGSKVNRPCQAPGRCG